MVIGIQTIGILQIGTLLGVVDTRLKEVADRTRMIDQVTTGTHRIGTHQETDTPWIDIRWIDTRLIDIPQEAVIGKKV